MVLAALCTGPISLRTLPRSVRKPGGVLVRTYSGRQQRVVEILTVDTSTAWPGEPPAVVRKPPAYKVGLEAP